MVQDKGLFGKHALITGGGHGIGGACAISLARHGANLSLTGRNIKKLKKMESKIKDLSYNINVKIYELDVTKEKMVTEKFKSAAKAQGAVDILINNAGIADSAPFLRTTPKMIRNLMEVNLIGAHVCTLQVIAKMEQAGWGRIINISSLAGLIGQPYISAYCASKHAMIGITRALALEVVQSGITVNAVCPAYVETGMVDRGIKNITKMTGIDKAQAREKLAQKNPQNRLISPEEVASTVSWLCLPGSESITGQSIAMAGGAWT